jgi:hypothetical protein
MNDHRAASHDRVITLDGRSDTSFQQANLGPDDFNAIRPQSGLIAA